MQLVSLLLLDHLPLWNTEIIVTWNLGCSRGDRANLSGVRRRTTCLSYASSADIFDRRKLRMIEDSRRSASKILELPESHDPLKKSMTVLPRPQDPATRRSCGCCRSCPTIDRCSLLCPSSLGARACPYRIAHRIPYPPEVRCFLWTCRLVLHSSSRRTANYGSCIRPKTLALHRLTTSTRTSRHTIRAS